MFGLFMRVSSFPEQQYCLILDLWDLEEGQAAAVTLVNSEVSKALTDVLGGVSWAELVWIRSAGVFVCRPGSSSSGWCNGPRGQFLGSSVLRLDVFLNCITVNRRELCHRVKSCNRFRECRASYYNWYKVSKSCQREHVFSRSKPLFCCDASHLSCLHKQYFGDRTKHV